MHCYLFPNFRRAFRDTGYVCVKKRDTADETEVLKQWLMLSSKNENCLVNFWLLRQLKLLVAFLRRFPAPSSRNSYELSKPIRIHSSNEYDSSKALAACITTKFLEHKSELSRCLRAYYLEGEQLTEDKGMKLLEAFRIWFGLPGCQLLKSFLENAGKNPTLFHFLRSLRPGCPVTTPVANLVWLYTFLYAQNG
ncbi:hypothetical protein EG68_06455 [Paragonimus skrjabini miyazakii]|uniref:Uncharacterized protein n=1 Tax=Paragonimus skrjabini miyazakii TaxID=59628 RepID=A0A8S9YCY9_9TREM|nr:hypothetical protein EG68_06455 [Paragonimus skrjabini miyazakii]